MLGACSQAFEKAAGETGKARRVLVFGDRPGRAGCVESGECLEVTMNLGIPSHRGSVHLCIGLGKEQTAAGTHLHHTWIRSQHGRGKSDHVHL